MSMDPNLLAGDIGLAIISYIILYTMLIVLVVDCFKYAFNSKITPLGVIMVYSYDFQF